MTQKSAAADAIAAVDVSALFQGKSPRRDAADAALLAAAAEIGFLNIVGMPANVPLGPAARAALLDIFRMPPCVLHGLWRRKFEPHNRNLYRGWFPIQPGNLTSKEGIDIGADVAFGAAVTASDDPLREPTPLPPEHLLPGWRDSVAAYYIAMYDLCAVLMQGLARGLGLEERYFDGAFHRGLSTLRLLHYPPRSAADLAACADPGIWVSHRAARRHVIGAPHTDSGFMTLLAQDGVPGLQVRSRQGRWLDVPPHEGALTVNFGQVLELWSAGRVQATEHRVLGTGQERFSIPFFYEARADAEISPLPMDDPKGFEPFYYGDYLWARIVKFVEFRGMEALRTPHRALFAAAGI